MDYYIGTLLQSRDAIDDGAPNPQGETLARLSIVFASLAGFFVILRLLSRYAYGKVFGADDVLIVGALVCSFSHRPRYYQI
jgi:hypothetical protein